MESWKESLKQAGRERTLARARSAADQGIRYVLGKGGFTPTDPMDIESDCSGFVAWAIGIPRELPPGSGRWLQTTTYWEGGGNVGAGLFDETDRTRAEPGDLYVYPDNRGKQGHIGIISEVQSEQPSKVMHCSKGNLIRHGDAIKETDPAVFTRHPKTRIMKIDYAALRALFDIPEPDLEAVEVPVAGVEPKHPLLADDSTLQMVAAGTLVLAPTGYVVGGCGPIHDALIRLADNNPDYFVNLGENRRYRGYYGPKTKMAIMNFQKDKGLPVTGEIDSATLQALDDALKSLDDFREPSRSAEYPPADSRVRS
jgi:hypothetical protein